MKYCNYLCFGCLNVRGLMKSKESTAIKLECIKNCIKDHNLNILMLQELKVHHDSKKKINVDWKKHFKKWNFYSDDKRETGILIRKDVRATEIGIFDGKNKGNQWCTWVVVYCKDKKIAIRSYYRSPSARSSNIDNDKAMADIRNIKKEIEYIKKNQEVNSFIVGGDTNVRVFGIKIMMIKI